MEAEELAGHVSMALVEQIAAGEEERRRKYSAARR